MDYHLASLVPNLGLFQADTVQVRGRLGMVSYFLFYLKESLIDFFIPYASYVKWLQEFFWWQVLQFMKVIKPLRIWRICFKKSYHINLIVIVFQSLKHRTYMRTRVFMRLGMIIIQSQLRKMVFCDHLWEKCVHSCWND